MFRILFIVALLLVHTSNALSESLYSEPTQNPNVTYRLFNTQNIYTFLKLDTRTGRIWQLQWGDKDNRFMIPINLDALVSNGKPGRFTLYPTNNIYAFILLDQELGNSWQVRWGDKGYRFIVPITE